MTRVGAAVVAARVCFTCGAQRVFSRPLGLWLYASRATVNGLTAALVFFPSRCRRAAPVAVPVPAASGNARSRTVQSPHGAWWASGGFFVVTRGSTAL